MITRLISTYYERHTVGVGITREGTDFCALLNYLLLFTILMICGNDIRISIVLNCWLVALETTCGRCKSCDCLSTISESVFLYKDNNEKLIIIIIESSWGHFKLSVRMTNLTNTSIIAANYQQIIRMICQFCRSIQLMIIMWNCHCRCCRRCRYRNSSLTTWHIARRWRRWPANGHNFKSNEHKCDENCWHDAYKVRRRVLCISDS